MRSARYLVGLVAGAGVMGAVLGGAHHAGTIRDMTKIEFDKDAAGMLPADWKVEGTAQSGPLATWQVITDSTAPSQPNALAIARMNHTARETLNLCWNSKLMFEDGIIEVAFRADAGKNDQGGGPIWRVTDANNYYLARANPLENSFRLYAVKDGALKQLATASADVPAGKWHTIKVEHRGDSIVCWLNGRRLLEATDPTIRGPGGIGVMTKADGITAFDNVYVTVSGRSP